MEGNAFCPGRLGLELQTHVNTLAHVGGSLQWSTLVNMFGEDCIAGVGANSWRRDTALQQARSQHVEDKIGGVMTVHEVRRDLLKLNEDVTWSSWDAMLP